LKPRSAMMIIAVLFPYASRGSVDGSALRVSYVDTVFG
jgi:hypothetical protein